MTAVFSLFLSFCLVACNKPEGVVEDNLVLRNKGADMPIWVRGNIGSQKIVLYLHGGPGDCAMCYRYYFESLEKDVAVAYWDQRVAGASSGNVDPATLNYEQFGEDAFLAINLLKQKYPDAEIYLLAHSFGVELAWQYLSVEGRQDMVKGLMLVNGTFSTYRWLFHVREWVLKEAEIQNDGEAKAWAESNPVTPESVATMDWQKLYRYMLDLGGNPVSLLDDKKFVLEYAFFSPNTALAQYSHPAAYKDVYDKALRSYDQSAVPADITIPVTLLWGKKDGVVPVGVAEETFNLLQNCPKKEIVYFENSWHEPFVSENDKFIAEVRRFLDL
ncbi:MAG: alpha/beta hydrolase [Saprospiraceae bacterium]|nr:alpha/beta hydrolase [Saprospiraceae bacterium]